MSLRANHVSEEANITKYMVRDEWRLLKSEPPVIASSSPRCAAILAIRNVKIHISDVYFDISLLQKSLYGEAIQGGYQGRDATLTGMSCKLQQG